MSLGDWIADISRAIDEHPKNLARDPLAQTWGRLAKIAEENGEVVEAFIGATEQNPRKGLTHTMDDVQKELFDVALTALAAWEHLNFNQGHCIEEFVGFVMQRKARLDKAIRGEVQ